MIIETNRNEVAAHLKHTASVYYSLAANVGVPKQAALDVARSLTELNLNLASFYDLPFITVSYLITSYFSGANSLTRLGVHVDYAKIKDFAFKNSIISQEDTELNPQREFWAKFGILQEDTKKVKDDFYKTLRLYSEVYDN